MQLLNICSIVYVLSLEEKKENVGRIEGVIWVIELNVYNQNNLLLIP